METPSDPLLSHPMQSRTVLLCSILFYGAIPTTVAFSNVTERMLFGNNNLFGDNSIDSPSDPLRSHDPISYFALPCPTLLLFPIRIFNARSSKKETKEGEELYLYVDDGSDRAVLLVFRSI
jgi:hypothetical protein